MAQKRRRPSLIVQRARELNAGRMSVDIVTGANQLRPDELLEREHPETCQRAFEIARCWHKENWFVELVCKLKTAFFNYGLSVAAADKRNRDKIKAAMDDPLKRGAVRRYVSEVWRERVLQDSVVSFWRREKRVTPYLLLAEDCEYKDAMGNELLKTRLNYRKEDFEGSGLTEAEIKRYTQRLITLDEKFDEYFQALTRGFRGHGFSHPRLYAVFRTLSQNESMEVGESMLAYLGRLVLRTHSLGFEVRSSANALQQVDYLWKATRAKAIENWFKGRPGGAADLTKQFDHKIEYVWPDPKLYDNRKWLSTMDRLMWWGGPVAFMVMAKTTAPFLLNLFKTEALEEREDVRPHLEHVINQGFRLGAPVKLTWKNRCFSDPRLAWDMVKTLMQQGPLSLRTALDEGDFDAEQEAEQKRDESKKERREELVPLIDRSGHLPEEGGGRPRTAQPGQRKAGVGAAAE